MAVPARTKIFALDSNFLFDLADGKDFAHALREALQQRGVAFRVPPTVVQELTLLAFNIRAAPEKRRLATVALRRLWGWGITPFDLVSVGHGITEIFAKKLIHQGLLPPEELNDGLIVAETALAEIPGLVTSDKHLLDIEPADLTAALKASDLAPVVICHPKRLLRVAG